MLETRQLDRLDELLRPGRDVDRSRAVYLPNRPPAMACLQDYPGLRLRSTRMRPCDVDEAEVPLPDTLSWLPSAPFMSRDAHQAPPAPA